MNLLLEAFPTLNECLRIAQLFNGESVPITGKLHSPEHDQNFNVQDAKLQIFSEPDNPSKLKLSINGRNILDWFKQKYQELKQAARPYIRPSVKPEVDKNKEFKL